MRYVPIILFCSVGVLSTSAFAAAATDLVCAGCVGTTDVANGAITNTKLTASLQNTINKLVLDVANLKSTNVGLVSDVAALKAANTQLQTDVTALQNKVALQNDVLKYFSETTITDPNDGNAYPTILLSGANLQVVNGSGSTKTNNGLGNIIVGYNELRTGQESGVTSHCSFGSYTDEMSCRQAGATWALNHRNGSHMVVVGKSNNYSRYGGILVGEFNTTNNNFSSVSGGQLNIAGGVFSSISGGSDNKTGGVYTSISGGQANQSVGNYSSILGGSGNKVFAKHSTIAGGAINTIPSTSANLADGAIHISGGSWNEASAPYSVVSGGRENKAFGMSSVIGGGYQDTVTGDNDFRAGNTLFADQ